MAIDISNAKYGRDNHGTLTILQDAATQYRKYQKCFDKNYAPYVEFMNVVRKNWTGTDETNFESRFYTSLRELKSKGDNLYKDIFNALTQSSSDFAIFQSKNK